MAPAHCPTCATYEATVMQRQPGQAVPGDLAPCADYAMSDAMRDWTVRQMQGDVMRQVSMTGLDRMAIVKRGLSGQKPDE